MLDLIRGFPLPWVDLAFPLHLHLFHPRNRLDLTIFATSTTNASSSSRAWNHTGTGRPTAYRRPTTGWLAPSRTSVKPWLNWFFHPRKFQPPPHFRIRNPIPQPLPATTIAYLLRTLTRFLPHCALRIWVVVPCPIVFWLFRYGTTSTSPTLIFVDYSSSLWTVTSMTSLSCLAIALITIISHLLCSLPIETSHWVLPATWLVHISDHTIPYIPYHLLCHKVVIAYTIAILVREVLHKKRAQKWKSQPSF